MWTRLERGYHHPSRPCSGEFADFCPPSFHYGCQFSECHHQKCISYNYLSYHDSIGCFCRLQHAAFSSTCRCWAPPTPLFLICRTLAEDASFVFFSLNRFVVSDTLVSLSPFEAFFEPGPGWPLDERSRARPPPSAYPAQRLAASQFLRDVVPVHCLGHLRSLEFVFPPYNDQCWPQDGHPALLDWVGTINWAKTKLRIPGLTLRLTMAGVGNIPPRFPDDRGHLSQAQGDQVLAGYDRILRPLACLGEGGLAHFYADFAWPWKWTAWVDEGHDAAWEWITANQDAMNADAERFILGDRYGRFSRKEKREERRPWETEFLPIY